MNNVSLILPQNCYGCELCEQICSFNSIQLIPDAEGFRYPVINETKCTECGQCLRYCPANVSNQHSNPHNKMVYALSLGNESELLKSSSGGAAYAIMKYAVCNGAAVAGVKYNDDYKGCHFEITQDLKDVELFRGTKYIQAKKNKIYNSVRDYLKAGKTVFFIGLPCEVAACKLFLGGKPKNIVFIELVCHGVTSPKVADEYVNYLENKVGKIEWLTIRDKRYGWTPGCLKAVFKNGREYRRLFDSTEYGYAFRNMSRPSCYNCKYKGDTRMADITIGDFWGATESDDFWKSNGVSVVFAHSEKGVQCIENLCQNVDVCISKTNYSKGIKNNSLINKPRDYGIRDKYASNFVNGDIFVARKRTETLKDRCIRILREIYYRAKR